MPNTLTVQTWDLALPRPSRVLVTNPDRQLPCHFSKTVLRIPSIEKLSSMVTSDVYGEDAVEAYANGGEAYFCGFTNSLATLTFDGETSTISGTDKDGNELFSHTYHYIGMEPVHGLYEFESDDADSGEFTYFFLAPDTSAETYHIEFRYGSDAEALSQYDAGEYAYWVASGISTDCDQTMIDNCIELFCTENLAG